MLAIGVVAAGGAGWAVHSQRRPATAVTHTSPAESTFGPTNAKLGDKASDAPVGMVWIPGGEFSMGSEDPRECPCGGPDAMRDARPIHRVHVDGFWMDKTEVTNEQFQGFVEATARRGFEQSIVHIQPMRGTSK